MSVSFLCSFLTLYNFCFGYCAALDAAVELYQDAVRSDPDSWLYLLNYIHTLEIQVSYDEVISEVKTALSAHPTFELKRAKKNESKIYSLSANDVYNCVWGDTRNSPSVSDHSSGSSCSNRKVETLSENYERYLSSGMRMSRELQHDSGHLMSEGSY